MGTILESEIKSQPEIIRRLLQSAIPSVGRIVIELREKQPRFVVLAARGTSDNAATYAKYLFGYLNQIPVVQSAPSLHTIYQRNPDMRDSLVIGISQSGEAPDVLAVMESAKQQHALTLSITNMENSPMASLADETILLQAGEELSVAATKTYTAQLTVIAMLAAYWNGSEQRINELGMLPRLVEESLQCEGDAQRLAEHFRDDRVMVVVGRGLNHATVHELALKTKELNYITTDPYSAADFRHGPIAVVEKDFPVLVIAPDGEMNNDMESLIVQLRDLGADLAVFSNVDRFLEMGRAAIRLPKAMPEWLSPIVSIVPGQLFAMHLALAKGYHPDHPRGLKKVTLTL